MRATRALIHTDNLRHNLGLIRDHTAGRPMICLAVKADAYGHGIVEVARTAASFGVEYLAVATVDEAVDLREGGIDLPILLYSLPTPEEVPQIIAQKATPVVADVELADLVDAEALKHDIRIPVHLKIDTGMGRIGCSPGDAAMVAAHIAGREHLKLDGVSTHFSKSDFSDRSHTNEQIRKFNEAVSAIRDLGINPGIVHAGNSGGVLDYPKAWYDMIRPGILAYGYRPSEEISTDLDLRPVMELQSRLVFIKSVDAGTPVSYGATWVAPRRTHIGTIPVGYGDGYSRALSNCGRVTVRGESYPIVGRVCMDHIMVDLGPECRVKRYDTVTLFGPGSGGPTAVDLADLCGTIPYEITCAVSKRVPRIYLP